MEYRADAVVNIPKFVEMEAGNDFILLDPQRPHWLATDKKGRDIAKLFNGKRAFGDVVTLYQNLHGVDAAKAFVHVDTFLQDAMRSGFAMPTSSNSGLPYQGREAELQNTHLKELWLHTNNFCNLTCRHCLVSSSPFADKGLPFEQISKIIHEAYALGVRRFYFTGGEPFTRKDIFELIHDVLSYEDTELVILTNATLLTQERLEKLKAFPRERLQFQVSSDGSARAINDSIRGAGTFEKICDGIHSLKEAGFTPTLTVVITKANAEDIHNMPRFARSMGLSRLHLLWLHKRGRVMEQSDMALSVDELIDVVKKTLAAAKELNVEVDNFTTAVSRLLSPANEKYDLSMAGYESLCVYSDGEVYPSAALANIKELSCGNALQRPLKEIYRYSRVLMNFRGATVVEKDVCKECPLKFICGGGDIEHSYYYSNDDPGKRTILGEDPYCELHKFLYKQAFAHLLKDGLKQNVKSGFTAPFAFRFMGDAVKNNAQKKETVLTKVASGNGNGNGNGNGKLKPAHIVRLSHSECVLTFNAYEGREKVQKFYKEAAIESQAELCCPTKYDPSDVGHIPQDVLDRFYGCGSPVTLADLKEGETFLDLGSGAGIDVFTASKKVGAKGYAIGVDMTDEMLSVATKCKRIVAQNLGYDNTAFYKGYLEVLPVSDKSVDCITSNCVINLSVNKANVFREMWRVLKDYGRIVISDIVSEKPLPVNITSNPQLWGECIGGALTENEFILSLKKAGFYGIETLKKTFWKSVERNDVFSVTVRGFKFEKKTGCTYVGQYAVYQGPYEAVVDEEGHLFPRGQKVEVCTDTFQKLSQPPYDASFVVLDTDETTKKEWSAKQKEGALSCAPGCC